MPARKRRWYLRGWAWCAWAFLLVVLSFALIAGWVWTKRYALMEDFVIDTLAERGFEAELDIASVTQTQAKVRNIRLKQGGQEIVRIGEVRAEYVWPDIREGRVKRLEMDAPEFTLRLDEDWKPSDPWLIDIIQGDGTNTSAPEFPQDGIAVTDGALTILSPLGEATFYTDAELSSLEAFDLALTLAPSDLSYGGFAAKGAGVVELAREGDSLAIDGQVQTDVLSNGRASIRDAHMRMDGALDLDTFVYEGLIGLDGTQIDIDPFAADAVQLNWDGEILPGETMVANGMWELNAGGARISDPARAEQLGDTLSLYPALRVVPVTEHFAPALKRMVGDFLVGTDLMAEGELELDAAGFILAPTGPLLLKTAENTLSLSPIEDRDFYRFDRAAGTIRAGLDAEFVKPVGLTLRDVDFGARSQTGYTLDGIETFSSRVATRGNWRATAATGEPVRLGPLSTRVDYIAGEASPRRLSLDTGLDYDGPLPGGLVSNLGLQGKLDVRLYETRQALDFTPRRGSTVTIARMETPTDWVAEDVGFTVPATRNIFVRSDAKSTLVATLQEADFALTQAQSEAGPAQRINLTTETMALNGTLLPSGVQAWTVGVEGATYASETLPGPGTSARADVAAVTAKLAPEIVPQITFDSPSVEVVTPLVEISGMKVSLVGTPEDYVVDHADGTVKLIGSAAAVPAQAAGLAQLPATGQVSFAEERFTGQTQLRVAKAGNALVDIDYTYANGVGEADIDIPAITFSPGGLQPQDLAPALRGKIARVTGTARAQMHVEFADGALTESDGNIDLVDMNIGTAPGPLNGVNTSIRLSSLWPVETAGSQTLTMKSFNPGFELKDGIMTYRLTAEGVTVDEARWPIGKGSLSLDPFDWVYAAEENRVVMRVEDIALDDFLEDIGNRKVEATGNVVGVFPVVIRGVQVLVDRGEISVPEGGVIRYDAGGAGKTYTQEEAIDIFRKQRSDEYSAVAQDALKEFNYKSLSASINGPLDGDIRVGLIFDGSNPKVLNSQPFRFDINVTGELVNIARSFNSNAQIKSEVLRQTGLSAAE